MMGESIDIAGIDKPAILVALYNSARSQGMGFLHYTPEPMTIEEATEFLTNTTYFDYVKGRVMKISLKTDDLSTALYDRDNGDGAARRALVSAGLL